MITVGQVLGLPGLGLEPVVEADTGLPVSRTTSPPSR